MPDTCTHGDNPLETDVRTLLQLQPLRTFDIMKEADTVCLTNTCSVVRKGDDCLPWNAGVIPDMEMFVQDPLHRSSNLLSLVITDIPGLYKLICHSGR